MFPPSYTPHPNIAKETPPQTTIATSCCYVKRKLLILPSSQIPPLGWGCSLSAWAQCAGSLRGRPMRRRPGPGWAARPARTGTDTPCTRPTLQAQSYCAVRHKSTICGFETTVQRLICPGRSRSGRGSAGRARSATGGHAGSWLYATTALDIRCFSIKAYCKD